MIPLAVEKASLSQAPASPLCWFLVKLTRPDRDLGSMHQIKGFCVLERLFCSLQEGVLTNCVTSFC